LAYWVGTFCAICDDGLKSLFLAVASAHLQGIKWVTTPYDIASSIAPGLAKKAVVAVVNGGSHDMMRPLEGDCELKLCTFDDEEGKDCWWHSSAHVLGQALELEFGVDLTIGPSIEEGFYYDCYMGDRTLSEGDRATIAKRMEQAVKENQVFQRVVVTRDEALGMFQENKFKVEIIGGLAEDAVITLYRCGLLPCSSRAPLLSVSPCLIYMQMNDTVPNSSLIAISRAEMGPWSICAPDRTFPTRGS